MNGRTCILIVLVASLANFARAEEALPRVLFLTQSRGFVHNPVKRGTATRSGAELAMMQLAKDSGQFTVVCSQNAEADITRENLQKFDIVAFYTSGDLPIVEKEMDYFLNDWLRQKGHGMMGFHSATDTFKNLEPYWELIGGTFAGHPWGAGSTVSITVHDRQHPAMKPWKEQFEFQDEIYQYDHWQPEKVRVLMSLDMEHTSLKRPYHVPVAWCKQVGQGRLFYNNMGHRDSTWNNEAFLASIVGAVRWIAGKEAGEATPNPEVSRAQHELSVKHSHASGITLESIEAERKAREAAAQARQAAEEKKRRQASGKGER